MKTVTTADFDAAVRNAEGVTLVDFFAPWCGPCQGMIPLLEEISGSLPEGHQIVKVNVDDSPELASEFGVMSIPAFKLFKGGEVVEETVGAQSKEAVEALFSRHA